MEHLRKLLDTTVNLPTMSAFFLEQFLKLILSRGIWLLLPVKIINY